ncbi:hypothetical protein ACFL0R_00660 [Pseudomonadota bacterium]
MGSIHSKVFSSHRAFEHCVEELLWHRSRYYHYAEQFLAGLAGRPDFCMAAYDADRLSPQQRQVLFGLLQEPPAPSVALNIIGIVTDVIQGKPGVDAVLLEQYTKRSVAASPPMSGGSFDSSEVCRDETISPAEPLQNMASRLGIPVEVKGREVRVPMRIVARYLDSPNPTVRRNLQDGILLLKKGGYRLINDRQRPQSRIDWDQQHGHLSVPVMVWHLLLRWAHLQKRNARHPIYSRSA